LATSNRGLTLTITVNIDFRVVRVGECGVGRRLQVKIRGRDIGALTNGLERELGVVIECCIESVTNRYVNSDLVDIVL
jgi:hypothetical protein